MNIRGVALIPLLLSSALVSLGETPIDGGWLPGRMRSAT